ncbi:MAG: D-glycero-beta-D-manno-heptose-7-phosphate kinase [Flavobacteriales bacterium]|nr:Bifunctional protein HldE [Flavobacteriales bacterium]MCC6577370.1 D-glycero-beta-D-manno-heptose-7-phosphate kinase [Flavobacteriales bacterium]NUQ16766.1 D-glycero-beta-D-manno-heptose-7-phosphate kinase [Flavobacteriales bacterium]
MTTVQQRFRAFASTEVLVLGDVMLDAYLWGRVDRISPEAPVPVVHVQERSARLGGAANVALNLHALGARPTVMTLLGDDEHAVRLAQLFGGLGLPTQGLLRSPRRRTTVKTRIISGHQHIVRVDEEDDHDLTDDDSERLLAAVQEHIRRARPGAIVFEDYDKGVLTGPFIREVVRTARAEGIPTAVDPKKRNFMAYQDTDLFKPNLKELREGLRMEVRADDPEQLRRAAKALENALGNRLTLLTLSEHGVLVHGGTEHHLIPAHVRSIADVSGAGDTVIAVATLLLAQGAPVRTLAAWANLAGGLVCEHVGVVPIDRERLMAECAALPETDRA